MLSSQGLGIIELSGQELGILELSCQGLGILKPTGVSLRVDLLMFTNFVSADDDYPEEYGGGFDGALDFETLDYDDEGAFRYDNG